MSDNEQSAYGEGLRRRNVVNDSFLPTPEPCKEVGNNLGEPSNIKLANGSYWLTRIVILRYLAFVYCIAFAVAYFQNNALIGKNGLLPTDVYLDHIHKHENGDWLKKLEHAPTVLWLFDYKNHLDIALQYLALVGLALSSFVLVFGCANIILMLTIWILYHSIVNVGQRWYSFGWESQILETGFLAAFLCPLLTIKRLPVQTQTPVVALWGYRWLIFRIMLGAGLIKIRGDKCWRDLTCMNYHYETQPVPNPLSYYMHQSPEIFHKIETMTNHVVELAAPILLLMPRRCRIIGGIIQILFQVVLILSGNLSFLNWLTIVPSLACFDDASISWMFSNKWGATKWQAWQLQHKKQKGKLPPPSWGCRVRKVFNICLGLGLAFLSVPIVQNLLSQRQIMNTSFDPLRIVNTYGAFGSITKERTEVILQGTSDNPFNSKAKWLEYEFKCKPGNIKRRPCIISPYHYRLDWLMWFTAFQNYQHNPWLVHLGAKLLSNDPLVTDLIAVNPFLGRDPPKWIRAEHYLYRFTKIGSNAARNGTWWRRKRMGEYMPAISLESVHEFMKNMGWPTPRLKGMKYKRVNPR